MHSNKIKMGAKFLLFMVTATAFFGMVVMLLWNWLMPAIFGLGTITYFQALGLLILSKILFSGFGKGKYKGHHSSHGRKSYWKEKFREKMENMSPEEREEMKEKFMNKCGGKFKHHPAWKMFEQEEQPQQQSTVGEVF